MRVALITPWRPHHPDRELGLRFVIDHYAPTNYLHLLADDNRTEQFSRTAARNAGALMAGDWDVAVFIDADCVVPIEVLEHGIEFAHREGRVVLPHDRFEPLSRAGSILAMCEPNLSRWDERWIAQPYVERSRPSGVVVFPRRAWDTVGGYDERFRGWGFEDTAMLWSLDALAGGFHRLTGRMWHIWHPSEQAAWLPSDKDLFERYKKARDDPHAMRALLLERQQSGDRLLI